MPSPLQAFLLGTALGDSIGLPFEGLSPTRIAKRTGTKPLAQSLVFGRGMVSDDTDHAAMALQALRVSGGDAEAFTRILGRKLRWWFAALPPGVGLATARACLKLWIGVRTTRSGIASAGNGPCMRAGVLGIALAHDPAARIRFTDAATRITHTDARALAAARVVAEAAAEATKGPQDAATLAQRLAQTTDCPILRPLLDALTAAVRRGDSPADFAKTQGWTKGVSGYAPHTVAAALACWLLAGPDPRQVITAAVRLGGDTDSVAAIAGGLACAASPKTLPADWLATLTDFPRSSAWLLRLGNRTQGEEPLAWWLVLPRNLAQLAVVLAHGFMRIF